MRRGIGSYVSRGYGGAKNAAARMGQAATSAARTFNVLTGLSEGSASPADIGFDPAALVGRPIDDVVDALVDGICRGDTTLDDNAGRQAVGEALSEVLDANPDLDPLAMTPEAIDEAYLRTAAYHVFGDMMLDLGPAMQKAAGGNAVLLNDRKVMIRDTVRELFRERLQAIRATGQRVTSATSDSIARAVIGQVMEVFQGWFE